MQDQLDPQVLNLSKAIRRAETGSSTDPYNTKGASGEFGAYQFMPATYKNLAKKHLGNENAEPTVENQNKITYSEIKELKDQGRTPAEIASIWNSGKADAYKQGLKGTNSAGAEYDVPAYVAKVSEYYKELSGNQGQAPKPVETVAPEQEGYKPWFKAGESDGAVSAGLKAAGNIIPSAINFGKNVISSLNPVNTLKNLFEIPEAFRQAKEANEGSTAKTVGGLLSSVPAETVKAVIPEGVRQIAIGDIAGATKTLTEDPFGQVAPVVLAAQGGAKIADNVASKNAMRGYVENIGENAKNRVPIPAPTSKYSGVFNKTVEKVARPVIAPVEAVASKIGQVGESLASRITGLDPQTVRQIIADPKSFSKLERDNLSRGGLAEEVKSSIEGRLDDLSEVGSGYNAVRSSNQIVTVPPKFIENVLAEQGLKVKGNRIIADSNSVTRNTSDIRAIEKFYKDWGKKKSLTPNEFLNMRSDLGELSKFDKLTGMGKTRASETIGKSLYERINAELRDTQLQELKALDETYSPERQFLKQIKKDFFNSDGTPKDNIAVKIANAGNKAELLKRLEGIMPGITRRIELLKAVEDIERASGNKVGAYARIVPGIGGYAAGGVVGALVAEIMTSPEMAVPILRNAGYIGSKANPVIRTLKTITGDIGSGKGSAMGLLSEKNNR